MKPCCHSSLLLLLALSTTTTNGFTPSPRGSSRSSSSSSVMNLYREPDGYMDSPFVNLFGNMMNSQNNNARPWNYERHYRQNHYHQYDDHNKDEEEVVLYQPHVMSQMTADPLIKPWVHPVKKKNGYKQQQQQQQQEPVNNDTGDSNPWAGYMTVSEQVAAHPAEIAAPRLTETAPHQPRATPAELQATAWALAQQYRDKSPVPPNAFGEYMTVQDDDDVGNLRDGFTIDVEAKHYGKGARSSLPSWELIADAEIVQDDDEEEEDVEVEVEEIYHGESTEFAQQHQQQQQGWEHLLEQDNPTMEELAEAWARMADETTVSITNPSMEELAEAWVRMKEQQQEQQQQQDVWHYNNNHFDHDTPASWIPPAPAPSSSIHGVAPPASWIPPAPPTYNNGAASPPPAGPVLVAEQSPDYSSSSQSSPSKSPSMEALVKEWAGKYPDPNNRRDARTTIVKETSLQGQENAVESPARSGLTMEDLAEAWARMTIEKEDPNNNLVMPNSMDDLAEAWARMTFEKGENDDHEPITASAPSLQLLDELAEAWAQRNSNNKAWTKDGSHGRTTTVNGSTLLQTDKPFFAESIDFESSLEEYDAFMDDDDEHTMDPEQYAALENLDLELLEQQARKVVERRVLEEIATILAARVEEKEGSKLTSFLKSRWNRRERRRNAFLETLGRMASSNAKL